LRDLHQIFRDRTVEKQYWAIVSGHLPAERGTLEGYLSQSQTANKSYVHDTPGNGRKKSRLDYHIAGQSDNYSFVEVRLHTGRHHQIRAQLAAAGAPIKGDLKYGARRSNREGGIYLFARSLRFVHPVSSLPLFLRAEPPADVLWDLFPRT
jgi:23S rRNA pseudouridine1911/1915/1917 synthase